ncbi:histone deacetylase [Halopseudomonas oceani]|uniref:Histone deacetylase n=1 Tax=Halopseudomonas oceani TaxID=1708783 RepID=A0A2P4EZ10_9GAMM|nr:histone deacetylase [Halopseudomonas oceani]POB05687.1 histone deacetylase [Halopseudomonas oceani]GGE41428.1 histone deacetylase [Halopseudomonas oceani]
MDLPLIYHPDYSFPFAAPHRFPMDKFVRLHDHLRARTLLHDSNLHSPDCCSRELLALAHAPDYVARFHDNALDATALRRMGLPWSEALVTRTTRAVGGSLLTAELALRHGLACHLAGGTHHAHRDFASGFCIFNDLAIISLSLLASERVERVMIIDCDVHQGDGTATILADVDAAITVSLHCENNFPARKAASDWDIPLPRGLDDQGYLHTLQQTLDYLLPLYQPDLVLYDAGVDVHWQDALGHLQLTDQGIADRDRLVIDSCLGRDIPVCAVIGGGYDNDRDALARRHGILHHSAAQIWQQRGLG